MAYMKTPLSYLVDLSRSSSSPDSCSKISSLIPPPLHGGSDDAAAAAAAKGNDENDEKGVETSLPRFSEVVSPFYFSTSPVKIQGKILLLHARF